MIYLNLLPYKFKKELRLRYIYKVLFRVCFSLVLTLVFIAGLFFSSSKILANFYKVIDSTNFLMGADVEKPLKVSDINLKVNEIDKIKKQELDWINLVASSSLFFKDLACIDYIEISDNPQKLKVRGVAHDRNSLITLKEKLEDSKNFSNINLPIKNIFQKENIIFELTADLNMR